MGILTARLKGLVPVCAITCLMASNASATTIFQDNFNADAIGIPASSLINWTIDSHTIDVVGSGADGYLCNGNTAGNCLDMEGSPGNGKITTKASFNLAAGDYIFSFDYGNNNFNNNSLTWDIGGITGTVFSGVAQNNTYTLSSTAFTLGTALSNARISFTAGGTLDNGGTVLDNVKLELASVPEPATLALFGIGLLGLGFNKRKIK